MRIIHKITYSVPFLVIILLIIMSLQVYRFIGNQYTEVFTIMHEYDRPRIEFLGGGSIEISPFHDYLILEKGSTDTLFSMDGKSQVDEEIKYSRLFSIPKIVNEKVTNNEFELQTTIKRVSSESIQIDRNLDISEEYKISIREARFQIILSDGVKFDEESSTFSTNRCKVSITDLSARIEVENEHVIRVYYDSNHKDSFSFRLSLDIDCNEKNNINKFIQDLI
jgi:hypothetical protein